MARVRPLRAWRYARTERDISPLVAPPYDVVPEPQRQSLLAKDPHNAVALELPEGSLDPAEAGNRYETGARRWAQWRENGVLARDPEPAFYLLEQSFEERGHHYVRRALLSQVELARFDEGIVLPHERTLPKALGDRFQLTRATAANFSPVFALFDDPEQRVDRLVAGTLATEPIEVADGDDGVHSRLWAITNPELIELLSAEFEDKRLFIADGHHRYTTALAYRDERRAADQAAGLTPQEPDYDFVLMALVNMDDPELLVLPTHRVADALGEFDPVAFEQALRECFVLGEVPSGHPAGALSAAKGPAFLVLARGWERPRLATLRDDVDLDAAIPLERSHAWKRLDVAVLQELVLLPQLGIHPDRPETLDHLWFVKDPHAAFAQVANGEHDVAFVLRATGMDQLREVALAGETMPQKSTYFHPKLLSGMLYRSID